MIVDDLGPLLRLLPAVLVILFLLIKKKTLPTTIAIIKSYFAITPISF